MQTYNGSSLATYGGFSGIPEWSASQLLYFGAVTQSEKGARYDPDMVYLITVSYQVSRQRVMRTLCYTGCQSANH